MRLSGRVSGIGGGVNRISAARIALESAGVAVTDLTDSNPTRHGLTDPAIMSIIAERMYDGPAYDPDPRGPAAARRALADLFGGSGADYWLTSSTSQAYAWLMTLLTDPGEAVAIPQPGYPLIEPIAALAGTRVTQYRSDYVHPDGWLIDPASLSTAVAGARAVVTVNPGNPTGAYLGGDSGAVIDSCREHGRPLIADEVFEPFALDAGGSASIGSLADAPGVVTFTLGGLSKLLCAPQLKIGWIRLTGPAAELPALRDGLDIIADAFLPVSSPVALALPDLLALAETSVARTRERLMTNLAAVRSLLADGPYRVRRTDGGWMVLVDVPPVLDSEDLALHLLERAHLAVHPGWFYDLVDDSVLALSLLPEPAEFAGRIVRLRAALDQLVARG